jgi:hypothetical protein
MLVQSARVHQTLVLSIRDAADRLAARLFRKVQTISVRAGDEQASLPSVGISWAELADRYRRRLAR